MTQISRLVSEDSRTPIERLTRTQCKEILKANGIDFDRTMPKVSHTGGPSLIKLIEGNGLDITKPLNGEPVFERVPVADEKGNVREELYPVEKEHFTKNKNIDYDLMIERQAKATEALDENEALKKRIAELEAKLEPSPDLSETEVLENMEWKDLRALAKEKGIQSFGLKKHELIGKLSGDTT